MSSFEGRRASGRLQAQEQATAPLPIGKPKNNTPRKQSTTSKRGRSASIVKNDQYSTSMPAPRLSGNMMDEDMGEDDDVADGPDGEVRTKIKGKRTKKGVEVFQCEKCSKWYRHPACLIKHRWQHTEYWATTSSYMMSKHQSVMMLEAAAILTNGSSLPESREFWPAAVSPPQSGLLGSEFLNMQTMRSRSPVSGSLTQQLMSSPTPEESSKDLEEEDDDEDVSMEIEPQQEDEGMFAFEMSSAKEGDNSSGGEADSGYASTGESSKKFSLPALPNSLAYNQHALNYSKSTYPSYPLNKPYNTSMHTVGSAPTLGFFTARQ